MEDNRLIRIAGLGMIFSKELNEKHYEHHLKLPVIQFGLNE